ncbi:MAG: hypothetical protein J7K84_03020, partial [Deltaproteobacteria bacterium]|nr:hypothetical protein [Deltaproteobacteria bacterium]
PDIDPALKNIILENPDFLFQYAYEHLKNSKRARLALIKFNGQKYLLKRYNLKNIFHKFRQLFRAPVSRKIWRRNRIFLAKGMLTSNLLASVDLGAGFSYQASFAIYTYIEGASKSICTIKKYYLNEQNRKKLLLHLAQLIWQMHTHGIYHGDAKITNFIWVERCESPQVWIIDLDGVKFKKKITNRNRLSDIKNMASSLAWWNPNIKIAEELLNAYIRLYPVWGEKRNFWLVKLKNKASKQLKHRRKRRGAYSDNVKFADEVLNVPLLNIAGIRWDFAPQQAAKFVIHTLESSLWNVVKTNPKRIVYKVGPYFVKNYNFIGFSGHFKRFFDNRALEEWKTATRLFNVFKNTPEPIAYGKDFNRAIMVTRSVEPCMTVKEFCHKYWKQFSKKKRYQIVDRFSNFIIHLYRSNLLQRDFNLGNILISSDYFNFFAIDLQYAKLNKTPLTEKDIARNLSYLLPPFYSIEKRYHIRLFLSLVKHFPKIRPFIYKIQDMAFAKMRHQWFKKNPRKLKENVLKSNLIITPNIKGYMQNDLDRSIKSLLVKNPDHFFDYVIKDIKRSKDPRIFLINYKNKKYVLKHYNLKRHFFMFRRMIFPSMAWKIWERTQLLSARKISTPILLAAIDLGKRSSYKGTFALYEYISEIKEYKNILGINNKQHKTINKLSTLILQMHNSGIYHGNARVSSFLCVKRGKEKKIYVVDLDNVRFVRKISARQRLSDLKDIIASLVWWNNDRLLANVFFDAYLKPNPLWCNNRSIFLKKLAANVEKQIIHRKNIKQK